MRFIEDMSVEERKKYFEERKKYLDGQKKAQEENERLQDWKKKARYRIKQSNVMTLEEIPVSNSSIRAEHCFYQNNNLVQNEIIESFYSFYPTILHLDDFLSLSDQSKRKIIFEINNEGKADRIINLNELDSTWNSFKKNEFMKNAFIKDLEKVDPDQIQKMITLGDQEMNDEKLFLKNLDVNLYFREIFGQYLTKKVDNFSREPFKTHSNFFPEIYIQGILEYQKISEVDDYLVFRKDLKLNYDELNEHDLIRAYNKFYKSKVKYSFSEYDYKYSVKYTLSKNDGLIDSLSINIFETVKNNISYTISFTLKRLFL